jgi:uncharacterized protein (TIGR03643 family)
MTQTNHEKSRIGEMAWENRTAFEAIEAQYGLNETAVIIFMRKQQQKRVSRDGARGLMDVKLNI